MDGGRTPDHGHLISPPREPNGSGELIKTKILHLFKSSEHNEKGDGPYRGLSYLSFVSNPLDLATWIQNELL